MPISAAAVGALGSIASGVIGGLFNKSAVAQQNDYNYQMYLLKQPKEVRAKLLDAGINPAFAIGNIAQGTLQTPEQSQPVDYNPIANIGQSATEAYARGRESDLAREQAKNMSIQNDWQNMESMLRVAAMKEDVLGKHISNYVQDSTKEMLINMTKNQERQSYTETATKNLLQIGSEWDVATKAMYAKVGQPLEFEQLRTATAQMSAEMAYRIKQTSWYDRLTSAQISNYYQSAAAALISAYANKQNARTNQYLSTYQAGNLSSNTTFTNSQNYQLRKLLPITEQSLKLGVELNQKRVGSYDTDKIFERIGTSAGAIRDIGVGVGSLIPKIGISTGSAPGSSYSRPYWTTTSTR